MELLKNVGRVDRIFRIILGVVLLGVAFLGEMSPTGAWILGILGVVLLGTASVRICLLYMPFRISTLKNR